MSKKEAHLRIGSRGSALALAQSELVKSRLMAAHSGLEVEIIRISTLGDRDLDRPLNQLGGKGMFTKELDEALLAATIDCAVHSLKDVPTELPAGLVLGAIGHRATPFDVLLTNDGSILDELPDGAKIGTSSLRRKAQLLLYRDDLEVVDIRGNVDTRLKKLDAGQVDALVLAAAGLERLGLQDRVSEILTQDVMVPAPGQGLLAIAMREGDARTQRAIDVFDDPNARAAGTCERGFLAALGGGCQSPAGALAEVIGGEIVISGIIVSPDGIDVYRGDHQGKKSQAAAIGKRLAIDLLDQGGDRVVRRARALFDS
ncbi:MAG: hydroxymethylbilane synthase [Candidatus Eisenbacteria bacterium]